MKTRSKQCLLLDHPNYTTYIWFIRKTSKLR